MSAPVEIRCEQFPVLSETFVVNEARALAHLGHPVAIRALGRPDPDRAAPDVPGLPVTYAEDETTMQRLRAVLRLGLRHPVGVARDLGARRRWRREEPVAPLRALAPAALRTGDRHVHVHFAKASALDALRTRRILGTRFSLTAHAYDIYAEPANLAEKLRGAAFVTTGCEYTARDLRALHPEGRVEVLVMGVDTGEFRRSTPHPDRRVVLAVGRLVEKKGFADLVRAVAEPSVRALVEEVRIVGEGPLRSELQGEVDRLGLGRTVRLVGGRTPAEVRSELERAAVLAMPSVIAADGDRDSMPVVVKEALAMEVPVVASDAVGLPEIVRREFGRLVAPGDPGSLGGGLKEVLALSAGERAAMGRAGRAHVTAHADLLTETRRLSRWLDG
jgi:colanic acid/amylovoran biosynthesis glycosyltransferase